MRRTTALWNIKMMQFGCEVKEHGRSQKGNFLQIHMLEAMFSLEEEI